MNIFNRREICITSNLPWLAQIKNCLEENNIAYMTKTDGNLNVRQARGTAVINSERTYNYRVYVHKKHYEHARHLVASLKFGKNITC